jgi:LuxR family transcriptional regulator, maltose regulon positive regulatory protein
VGRDPNQPVPRQRLATPSTSSRDSAVSTPPSDLLTAKLAVPRLSAGVVVRPRLMDRMAAGASGRVTLVIAGPGWGKTQLVASWVATGGVPGPVAWLSLDSHDNDPVVFWSYFLAALRATGTVPAGSTLSGLSMRAPMGEDQLLRIGLGLAALPRHVTLVLDDWHEIRDGQVVNGLSTLLRHATPLHLVLISRSDPRLRLHRLLADGGLTEIRAAELAFTPSEAEELLQQAAIGLPSAQRQALVERTAGWATGLRLAAQFAARPGFAERIDEFAGDERTVAEYLVEEVLADMPATAQRFLLRTSVAEPLCGELADALTDGTDGQRELEALEGANAFVVALGPGHRWFRYHPLLADLLRHRVMLQEPDLLPELHRRAARWYASRGEALEALRHAARAGDWQLLGELVVSSASMRVVSAERQALEAILAEIPAGEMHASPELRVCAALRHFIARDYVAMANDTAQARVMLSGRDPQSRQAIDVMLRVLDLVRARIMGDVSESLDAATDLLTLVAHTPFPALPAAGQYEAVALNNRGVALLWLTRTDEAEDALRSARAVAKTAGLELVLVNASGCLGLVELDRGRCQTASLDVREALEVAEFRGWTGLGQAVVCFLALAALHLEWDDLPEAQRLLDAGLAAHRNDPERIAFYALQATQARIHVAGGNIRQGRRAIAACTALGPWAPPPLLRRWLATAAAELDLAAGDPRAALELIRPIPDTTGHLIVSAVRAHLALGDVAEAERLLAPAREASGSAVVAVEAWLLTALAADQLKDETRALSALEEALAIAQLEQIRRPFVAFDRARLHALLLRRPRLSAAVEPFANDLLARLADHHNVGPPGGALTAKERAVLSHLAMMQTNEDIGADLFVSVNTVKAHSRSVYRKLGVTNRRAAVLRARDLGLL